MRGIIAKAVEWRFVKKFILTITVFAIAATAVYAANFSDTKGHWAEFTIDRLVGLGVVDGVGNGYFDPQGDVTRSQFLKMIMELKGISTSTPRDGECLDANVNDWDAPYLQGALDKGLIPKEMIASYKASVVRDDLGATRAVYSGAFNGNLPITREEMAVITQNMYQYWITEENVGDMVKAADIGFYDKSEISPWALQCVKLAVAEGFMDGMDGNVFAPKSTATRAQAATILGRVIDRTQ